MVIKEKFKYDSAFQRLFTINRKIKMADLLTRMRPGAGSGEDSRAKVWKVDLAEQQTSANNSTTTAIKSTEYDLVGKLRSGDVIFAGTGFVTVDAKHTRDSDLEAGRLALEQAKRRGFDCALVAGETESMIYEVDYYLYTKK